MSIASQYVTGRKIIIRIHPWVYKDQHIWALNNVCSSVPFKELTASLTSVYTLSLLVEEIVASMGTTVTFLATVLNPDLVCALTSVYGLATAVT